MKRAEFFVISTKGSIHVYEMKRNIITIGRGEFDIQLHDEEVSRKHATIELKDNSFTFKDLDSKNGSLVNEKLEKEVILRDGDQIKLGSHRLIFCSLRMPLLKIKQTVDRTILMDAKEGVLPEYKISDMHETGRVRAEADLESLYKAAHKINGVLILQELYPLALDIIVDSFPVVDCCSIHRFDKGTGGLLCKGTRFRDLAKAGGDYKFSRSILQCVMQERKAILTYDAMEDSRFNLSSSVNKLHIRSSICVPLQYNNEVIGLVQANTLDQGRKLVEADLKLLTAIAAYVCSAWANALLYEKVLLEKDELLRVNNQLKAAQSAMQ